MPDRTAVISVNLIDGDNVVWRVSLPIQGKALYRMGIEEYNKVAKAAADELYSQISKHKRKNAQEPEKEAASK